MTIQRRRRVPVESCHSLSAWGYFQWAQMWFDEESDKDFSWDAHGSGIVIHFTRDGLQHSRHIETTTTPCRFGGQRFWFLCPQCSRRVGKVYLPCSVYTPQGNRVTLFLCRDCHPLTYLQRRERKPDWSLQYRADRIDARWMGEQTRDFIFKRKGQRWRTFNKRFEQRERLIAKQEASFISKTLKLL